MTVGTDCQFHYKQVVDNRFFHIKFVGRGDGGGEGSGGVPLTF